ncbi:hypothetical protein BpHYR1_051536 [Brachionus plicatilis]|uniref:Uncharacterized protein n=1 Tax=Brachionus plicatilis TaxID=10195 RepID=A0A3M7SFK9_BRAPC|nr:hypothetical protein BpHYR1_051536 [Brachionus plicatilis]
MSRSLNDECIEKLSISESTSEQLDQLSSSLEKKSETSSKSLKLDMSKSWLANDHFGVFGAYVQPFEYVRSYFASVGISVGVEEKEQRRIGFCKVLGKFKSIEGP